MWKQIKLLTKINLCNIGGLNQIRYGHNPKEKKRAYSLAAIMILLGIMCICYSAGLSYAFVSLGIGALIPPYAMTLISLIILFFSIYKAGSLIFEAGTYEMLSSLPIAPASIVLGRFSAMYLQNLLLSGGVLIPSACVYGIFLKPSFTFYIKMAAGIVLIPLLPMTIAIAAGALITAVSSRMRHKNFTTIFLSMFLVLGIVVLSLKFSANADMMTDDMFRNLAVTIETQLYRIYPPAKLFAMTVNGQNMSALLELILLSVLPFIVLIYIIQRYFASICTALNSKSARKNYEMTELKQQVPMITLYKKELTRYLASPLYVLNTSIGYVLMVIAAVSILITGTEEFERILGYEGIIQKILPFLLAVMCSMASTTTSSISMEGKNWWIVQSLPIPAKSLFNAKILVNLTLALPCYALTQLLLIFKLNVSFTEHLAIILLPLVYIFFISVTGITMNRKMPQFQWTVESSVIKQSAASLTAVIIGIVSVLVPAVFLFIPGVPSSLVSLFTAAVIGMITVILYMRNNRIDLRTVGE